MAYRGQSIIIPLGDGGIVSDVPQSRMPSTSLIEARNVTLANGYVEKHYGSRAWQQPNPSTGASNLVNGGVAAFQEYFPEDGIQRIIALSKFGNVVKFRSRYESITVYAKPGSGAPVLLNYKPYAYYGVFGPKILIGGNETAGGPRKVFIFSGADQVQVIEGDDDEYRPIAKPAADWSTSYPTFGVIHRDRLWVFGNTSAPDILYASALGNQEDFQTVSTPAKVTDTQIFDVATGEGDGISAIFVFKSRLFIVKKGKGLYQLNDQDLDPANWSITRVNEDFGIASPHAVAQIFDDVLLFNNQGTITSLSAAFQLGDIESADVFNKLGVERYFRQDVSAAALGAVQAVYYQPMKQIYFMYQSKSGLAGVGQIPNRILCMDMLSGGSPKLTLSDKDTPLCLGLITDSDGLAKPCYGSYEGSIWEMTFSNRAKFYNSGFYVDIGYWQEGYTVIGYEAYNFVAQTPHLDFGYADPGLATKTKKYDFLELTFQPTGDWDVLVDVFIDSELKETISFNLLRDRPLGDYNANKGFTLDVDRVDGDIPKSVRKPLHGQGRTISFRLRSNGLSQNIKLQSLQVSFRASDERQIKDLRT